MSAKSPKNKNQYNHLKIESKWQKIWQKKQLYKTTENTKRPKSYVLDMFPYPSGEGLHVGHPKGYIATDIYSRFKRQNGFNVLHPMGWDAFGLPAENYAIKNKIHPGQAVKKNIKHFKSQLEKIGFDYDWSKEIDTTDPKYYKWTQWIFLQLYKKGLAYQSYEPINWCPSCQTGLANEDLEDGKCERCGSEIIKKPMRQWVLKITDYADRLLTDLDKLNWPESIKESQRNWIGKSEGSEIKFEIKTKYKFVILHGWKGNSKKGWFPWLKRELEARGHEVVIPDLPIPYIPNVSNQVDFILKQIKFDENTVLVGHSLGTVVSLRILEKLDKPIKKLVLISGLIEPRLMEKTSLMANVFINWKFNFSKIKKNVEEIKILRDINDYLIVGEESAKVQQFIGGELIDFEAEKSHTTGTVEPIVLEHCLDSVKIFTTRADTIFGATYLVIAPEHKIIDQYKKEITNLKEVKKYINQALKRSYIERTAEGKEKTGIKLEGVSAINPANKKEIPIFVADYVLADYGTGAIMAVPAHDQRDREFAKKFNLPIIKVIKEDFPTIVGNIDKAYTGSGQLINSGLFNNLESERVKKAITKYVRGKIKTNYKLRDWVFSRQRYWGEPIPIIHCKKCAEINPIEKGIIPVPEKDLPIKLPAVKSYAPSGTGESPLAKIDKWVNVKCPVCNSPAKRETNTMPQWAGSSWYYLRYIDQNNTKDLVDKKKDSYWSPVDLYVGGTEHATRHLIYARFWHKFLYDIGVVNYPEPFTQLKNQGLIMASDGRKMSKRWGNVINPDDMVKNYGADTLRIYEMFIGPFEQSANWSTDNLIGSRRFIEKVWRLSNKNFGTKKDAKLETILNQTIKKVTEDIENFSFNTAISAMMILANEMEKEPNINKKYFTAFLKILAPFAPHITEEIWLMLGGKESIHLEPWPEYDLEKIKEKEIKIIIQVNGKIKDLIVTQEEETEEQIVDKAQKLKKISNLLKGQKIKRTIFIKDKLVNFVI